MKTKQHTYTQMLFLFLCFFLGPFCASAQVSGPVSEHITAETSVEDYAYWSSDQFLSIELEEETRITDLFLEPQTEDGLPLEEEILSPIKEISDQIKHYPNPVRRHLTIEDPDRSVQKIIAYTEQGDRLFLRHRDGFQQFFLIDLDHLPTGLYYFRLLSESDLLLKRFRVLKKK